MTPFNASCAPHRCGLHQNNDGFTTSCNDEVTQILAKDAYGVSGRDDFNP